MSQLRQLLNLLTQAVETLERLDTPIPSLDSPYDPEKERLQGDPRYRDASQIVVAAASQMIAAVRQPQISMLLHTSSYHISSALQFVIVTNVVEILREAGPQVGTGLHLVDLAAKATTDASILGRILRFLATNHIFREVSIDVFANNRLSSVLDTGKPVDTILTNTMSKFDEHTIGTSALVGHLTDEALKASGYLTETILKDPKSIPFNKALNTDLNFWSFIEQPEQEFRLRRFGAAMAAARTIYLPNGMDDLFDWTELPDDALVVDVGGGVGAAALPIFRQNRKLRLCIQDREPVMEDATKFWMKEEPEALQSGQVTLQAHDFFEAQPHKSADIFFLKYIIHDWADADCITILSQLRASASPSTRLVVMERIIHHVGEGTAPEPLLKNWGQARIQPYLADMTMMTLLGAQERTVQQYERLFEATGWKLEKIYGGDAMLSQLLCVLA